MVPEHYFKVICCPNCKSSLEAKDDTDELVCRGCNSTYPVVEDIPILLRGVDDEISQIIKQFYDSEWKKNEDGVLRAKVAHEDLSNLGQRYIRQNENRLLPQLDPDNGHEFFLDAASGAQPRVEFGSKYTYHICVDFSLDGMIESRRLIGDRAICVVASLLSIPLQESSCDGILAAHVLYHLDEQLQGNAIRQLARVMRPEGKMILLYGNPNSIENLLIRCLKKVTGKKITARKGNTFYYYAHPIDYVLTALRDGCSNSKVRVESLRLFTNKVTRKAFNSRMFGKLVFNTIMLFELILGRKASFSSYVAFITMPHQQRRPG